MIEQSPICCLCWLDGIRSPAIKGWPGFPICREHIADVMSKNEPAIPKPSPGIPSATLQ
jgi:hypothetical protein